MRGARSTPPRDSIRRSSLGHEPLDFIPIRCYIDLASSTEGRFREASQGGTNRGGGAGDAARPNLPLGAGEAERPIRPPADPGRCGPRAHWLRWPVHPGGSGTPPGGHYDPPARSIAELGRRNPNGNPSLRKRGPELTKRRKPFPQMPQVERRKASASRQTRAHRQRWDSAKGAPLGAPPPPSRSEGKQKSPGRKK